MQGRGGVGWSVRAGAAGVLAPRLVAIPDFAALPARGTHGPPDASTLSSFPNRTEGNVGPMVGIRVAAVLAALTFAVCISLGLPVVLGIVFALIVLVASVPTLGGRFGI